MAILQQGSWIYKSLLLTSAPEKSYQLHKYTEIWNSRIAYHTILWDIMEFLSASLLCVKLKTPGWNLKQVSTFVANYSKPVTLISVSSSITFKSESTFAIQSSTCQPISKSHWLQWAYFYITKYFNGVLIAQLLLTYIMYNGSNKNKAFMSENYSVTFLYVHTHTHYSACLGLLLIILIIALKKSKARMVQATITV